MPRGRPKGSKNRPKAIIQEAIKELQPPKRRGRPSGSKNKPKGEVIQLPKAEPITLQPEPEPIPVTQPNSSSVPTHVHTGKLLSFGTYQKPASTAEGLLHCLRHSPKCILLHPWTLDPSLIPFGTHTDARHKHDVLSPTIETLKRKGIEIVPSFGVMGWEVQIEV